MEFIRDRKLELEERSKAFRSFIEKQIVKFILACRALEFSEEPPYDLLKDILAEKEPIVIVTISAFKMEIIEHTVEENTEEEIPEPKPIEDPKITISEPGSI